MQGQPILLADLFGVSGGKPIEANTYPRSRGNTAPPTLHTYLRLTPELRAASYGPKSGDEPAIAGKRHAILAGFDETDLLPFGGSIAPLKVAASAQVLATFVPPFPQTPPEIVWMSTPKTDIPAVVINESRLGRVAYLAADIDRRFAIDNFPDHGDLLANLVRWAAKDSIPLQVEGRGLVDCELYGQENRLTLHLVNLTSASTWRAPMHELIPIGPLTVKIRLPAELRPKQAKLLVGGQSPGLTVENAWASFVVPTVLDHEVIVLQA